MKFLTCVILLMSSMCVCVSNGKNIFVQTQADWDCLKNTIASAIAEGDMDITVDVKATFLQYGQNFDMLSGVNAPSLRLSFKGNGVIMIPYGETLHNGDELLSYSLDDVFLDGDLQPIDNKETAQIVREKIESVPKKGEFYIYKSNNALIRNGEKYNSKTMNTRYNVYRFRVDIPDLSEEECTNFYMLLSRQWAYYRHKVIKVENGYLYFKFVSDEAPSDVQKYGLDPNSDIAGYGIQPRYRFINYPLSKGFRVQQNKVICPSNSVSAIYHGIGDCLFRFYTCNIASLVISNFDIRGCAGDYVIGLTQCQFKESAVIINNAIRETSQCAMQINKCSNVLIQGNKIEDTRRGAITLTNNCINCRVENNTLRRIGWMGQTFGISANGENIKISNNQIEDFIYSAISTGRNSDVKIKGNSISYSTEYAVHYKLNTICDGGAIYVGPGVKSCEIADNLIVNICGNGANRGIFCDDGCCNMDIHGNFILMNHHGKSGEYDIDLRYCTTYKSMIPEHNTNNKIYGNYLTGFYRFQGIGDDDGCFDGSNYHFDTGLLDKNKLNVVNHKPDVVFPHCEIIDGYLLIPSTIRRRVNRIGLNKKFKTKIKYKKQ